MTDRQKRMAAVTMAVLLVAGCAGAGPRYQNKDMDFGSIHAVAVMPFWNLTKDQLAGERVRDVFQNMLLAQGAFYVLPTGEVARGVARTGITAAVAPSSEEVVKLGGLLKVDAVITGVLKEYGEIRSSSAAANVVSLSLQMYECSTGKVVWAASSTKGGVSAAARILGTSGGDPVNDVPEQAVDDLINKLFK
jgi:polysaccharide biosynthesis protein PelC